MILDNVDFFTVWCCFCLLVTGWIFYGNNLDLYHNWLEKILDKSFVIIEIPIIGLPLWLVFYFFFGWIMKYLMMFMWTFTLFLGVRLYCGGWSFDCIEQSSNFLFGFVFLVWLVGRLFR